MSTRFTLHDLDGTPTPPPPLPSASSVSVIAECEIKDLDAPGPQVTHDSGYQIQRRPGTTPPGLRRSLVTKLVSLVWEAVPADEIAALERFYSFVGTGVPFWLTLPAEVLWPVPAHAGMVLPGGVPLTPGSWQPGTRYLLADGETVTFRSTWFEQPFSTSGLAYRRADQDDQTQWRALAMLVLLELPAEEG